MSGDAAPVPALRYVLFALPGAGDETIRETTRMGLPPSLVVHSSPNDFSRSALPRLWRGEPEFERRLVEVSPEAILIAGWEEKLPEAWYAALPRGAWNIHPSLLPAYRGFNPYFWVIANGEATTGVTVHRLTGDFDAGPVLLQESIPLDPRETLASLWHRLARLAGRVATAALPLIASGDFMLREQATGEFPRAPRVTPADLVLSNRRTMLENARLIRAANPFYGAALPHERGMLKVFVGEEAGEGPSISCRDGQLVATVVQDEQLGLMTGKEFRERSRS